MTRSKMIPYWEMNPTDLKLHLLKGSPLLAKDVVVTPVKLGQIVDIGYSNYSKYLSILSVRTEDFFKSVPKEQITDELKNLTPMELIFMSNDRDVTKLLLDALCFFLQEDNFYFNDKYGLIFGEEIPKDINDIKCVNKNNYTAIVEAIKHQNGLIDADSDLFNPSDENARKVVERLQSYREIVKKAKRAKGESENSDIDFSDIVSAVSTKSNTFNKYNIWDATIYQVYDEFRRLEAISGYETSILAMVNGAKIDDLKHWSSKIEQD